MKQIFNLSIYSILFGLNKILYKMDTGAAQRSAVLVVITLYVVVTLYVGVTI